MSTTEADFARAVELIRAGELVAFPTASGLSPAVSLKCPTK